MCKWIQETKINPDNSERTKDNTYAFYVISSRNYLFKELTAKKKKKKLKNQTINDTTYHLLQYQIPFLFFVVVGVIINPKQKQNKSLNCWDSERSISQSILPFQSRATGQVKEQPKPAEWAGTPGPGSGHTHTCAPKLPGEPESLSLTALRRPREGAIGHPCWALDSAGESPEESRGLPAPEVHDLLGKAACQTQLSLLATGPAPDVCRGRLGPKWGAVRPPGPAAGRSRICLFKGHPPEYFKLHICWQNTNIVTQIWSHRWQRHLTVFKIPFSCFAKLPWEIVLLNYTLVKDVQTHLRETSSLVPNHHKKPSITIKWITQVFVISQCI